MYLLVCNLFTVFFISHNTAAVIYFHTTAQNYSTRAKMATRNEELLLWPLARTLLSAYWCSSETDYNSALLQRGVTIQSDGSENFTQPHWEGRDCMHLLLNKATGNATLHNGCVVLLGPQRKLQLSDQTPPPPPPSKKSKVSLGKYQLPAHVFRV